MFSLQVYGVSSFEVNYMSMCYMILFLPVNFPSTIAIDKWGLRSGILIGITLTTLGLWVRCLINQNFIFVLIGQSIQAIG